LALAPAAMAAVHEQQLGLQAVANALAVAAAVERERVGRGHRAGLLRRALRGQRESTRRTIAVAVADATRWPSWCSSPARKHTSRPRLSTRPLPAIVPKC